MENKFLAVMIVYVMITTSTLVFVTGGEYISSAPVIEEVYDVESSTLSQLVVGGEYKINDTYGIYTDSIVKILNYPTNPVKLQVPVLTSEYNYITSYRIYNPEGGKLSFTFVDFFSAPLYQVLIEGNDITIKTNEEEETYYNILPKEYTLSIGYDIRNENFIIRANGFTNTLKITSSTFKINENLDVWIFDNYVYLNSIQVESTGEQANANDVNPLTQLLMILAWNVEGLPLALNLIFVKAPLLCIAIGIFQLVRGN